MLNGILVLTRAGTRNQEQIFRRFLWYLGTPGKCFKNSKWPKTSDACYHGLPWDSFSSKDRVLVLVASVSCAVSEVSTFRR